MHQGLFYELARDRYDERLREAEAARLAAQAAAGHPLRRRLGLVLIRLGEILAEADEPAVSQASGR